MILVVSDVHGNADALHAILDDARRKYDIQKYAVLGDMFTLGPSPLEVYETIVNLPNCFFIRGNHEDYLTNKIHEKNFPKIGNFQQGTELYTRIQTSIKRTYLALGESRIEKLHDLCIEEYTLKVAGINHYFCHGTPNSNTKGVSNLEAESQLEFINDGCLWAGHIHHQMLTEFGGKKFINPGGSGLPFDGDHRAPYAVIDKFGVPQLHRVSYSYENVIRKLNEYSEDHFAPILQKHLEFAKLVKHPIFG